MSSEMIQALKNKSCIISLICGIKKLYSENQRVEHNNCVSEAGDRGDGEMLVKVYKLSVIR